MSDTRHCDGPDCNITAPLNEGYLVAPSREIGELTSDDFIVLTRKSPHRDLHFHADQCMREWTLASTRERSGRAN